MATSCSMSSVGSKALGLLEEPALLVRSTEPPPLLTRSTVGLARPPPPSWLHRILASSECCVDEVDACITRRSRRRRRRRALLGVVSLLLELAAQPRAFAANDAKLLVPAAHRLMLPDSELRLCVSDA